VVAACQRATATLALPPRARARGGRKGTQAEPASANGPEARRRPTNAPAPFFFFLNFFSQMFSNSILINLKVFSELASKTKAVQNKILYNFALRWNPNF